MILAIDVSSFSKLIHSALHTFVCAGLVSLTGGCASPGRVVVDFALDVEVAGHDRAGRTWRATTDAITTLPQDPKAGSPFSYVQFQGAVFHWQFTAGSRGFGGRIRSQLPGQACFRFDQARLTSSMQAKEIPMRVSLAIHHPSKRPPLVLQNMKVEDRPFVPPPFCFSPDQAEFFNLAPDLSELFPSSRMFNVSWSDNEPTLVERGIGKWLKIFVPVEYEGKRDELEITLTATNSKAKVTYSLF